MPVIGFLNSESPGPLAQFVSAFHRGLNETGYVEDDKDAQERIVRRSKLERAIVRPVILTDGPKINAYRALADPRDWTCGFISRADVADFLIKQIDDGRLSA